MTDFWDTVLTFAETTGARVGTQLMADFGAVQASEKADGSLITRSDKWADEEIRNAITSTFPAHGILSEEGEHVFPDNEWCWIIDPLDGTTNFARGIPVWAISMALLHRGTPVFGYIHLPPIGQTFHGFWGEPSGTPPTGAFLNRRPIHTHEDSPGSNHFFSFCSRSILWIQHPFPCKVRMLGVASYNFLTVAAGFTLGGVEATPKIWDLAGVWAIVRAAGGAWLSLHPEPLFPLTAGRDYGKISLPTLVASQEKWVPVFQSKLEPFRKSSPG